MPDSLVTIRFGDVQDIQSATVAPTTGTENLETASVTLRDTFGVIAGTPPVSGVVLNNTQDVGGFISDPDVSPFAWYRFNPVALELPNPGTGQKNYLLDFLMTDSAGESFVSTILVCLKGSSAP